MITEKIGGGVESGTATVNNTYISSGSVTWRKQGNVLSLIFSGVTTSSQIPAWTTIVSDIPTVYPSLKKMILASEGWKRMIINYDNRLVTENAMSFNNYSDVLTVII